LGDATGDALRLPLKKVFGHGKNNNKASSCGRHHRSLLSDAIGVHITHSWHVILEPVPASGHARRNEIQRRRALLPLDLPDDPVYAKDSC
jgi:hypothetical protein